MQFRLKDDPTNYADPGPDRALLTTGSFHDPHPNPEHMLGVLYDTEERCAYIDTPDGERRADLGDWIIRNPAGSLRIEKGKLEPPA